MEDGSTPSGDSNSDIDCILTEHRYEWNILTQNEDTIIAQRVCRVCGKPEGEDALVFSDDRKSNK